VTSFELRALGDEKSGSDFSFSGFSVSGLAFETVGRVNGQRIYYGAGRSAAR
jgi:hypothetical protein